LRRDRLLAGWLRALPDDVIRQRPVLSAHSAWMSLVAGDLDGFEARLRDAERALEAAPARSHTPPGAEDPIRTLPAWIASYRAAAAQARGDTAATAAHARAALELAGLEDHFARGGAVGFLGLAAWAEGDLKLAVDTFTLAVTSLGAAGNVADQLGSTGPGRHLAGARAPREGAVPVRTGIDHRRGTRTDPMALYGQRRQKLLRPIPDPSSVLRRTGRRAARAAQPAASLRVLAYGYRTKCGSIPSTWREQTSAWVPSLLGTTRHYALASPKLPAGRFRRRRDPDPMVSLAQLLESAVRYHTKDHR
jgi:MalT-like TPR region